MSSQSGIQLLCCIVHNQFSWIEVVWATWMTPYLTVIPPRYLLATNT
ncbi:hypothetical protein INQ25_04140 [Wolbachia endosymbiont of Rhagoletis cerasi]|nr:hypothetical protein [Wolbachia endosymbiont of Rhagoletis cerasi]MBS9530574.1 hypothetical protein [Wolbachia endosymbiont of Rhagoletis cerasi]